MAPAMTMQPDASKVRSAWPRGRRLDDLLVPDPEIALAEASVDRIDDVAAGDLRQHGHAASAGTCSAIARMMAAADGSSEAASAPIARQGSGAAGIDDRVVVDAGFADRDGDSGARRPAVPSSPARSARRRCFCGGGRSRRPKSSRCKSASPAAIIRATSKRQGSNSGKAARKAGAQRKAGHPGRRRRRCPSRFRWPADAGSTHAICG